VGIVGSESSHWTRRLRFATPQPMPNKSVQRNDQASFRPSAVTGIPLCTLPFDAHDADTFQPTHRKWSRSDGVRTA
jgi:hypothetical protein